MKVGKPKSKRVPVRLRHKIEKASSAKQRKERKLEKKNPQWRSKLKKDPGIPNLFPYKDKLIAEIEESKRLKEEEARRRRDEAKARRQGNIASVTDMTFDHPAAEDKEDEMLDYEDNSRHDREEENWESNPMAALLASAKARAAEFDLQHNLSSLGQDTMNNGVDDWSGLEEEDLSSRVTDNVTSRRADTSRRAYDKDFKQVLASSDVVLYVLDARDPEGTRSREVEREVTASPSKRLMLILNKIDLIPPAILRSWLLYLRRSFPTLPLRASNAPGNAKTFNHKQLTAQGTSKNIFNALKGYASTQGDGQGTKKGSITVGVLGYPNVGKSSVVTALASQLGRRGNTAAVPVGAEAGLTTSVREVKLDSKLRLLDSPGIIFPGASTESKMNLTTKGKTSIDERANLVLLNALPSSSPQYVELAIPAVSLLLRRLSRTAPLEDSITQLPNGNPTSDHSDTLLEPLLSHYAIPALPSPHNLATDATTAFLVQVARQRGRLGKGGVPNLHSAAVSVLADWRDGRIAWWSEAPKIGTDGSNAEENATARDQKEVVKEWAKEFKIEGLWADDMGRTYEADGDLMQE